MDFRINGTGRGFSSGAGGASSTRAQFVGAQAVNTDQLKPANGASSDASVVTLAAQNSSNSSSGTDQALRTLSDAESYISIAANAASSIEDLLGQLGNIYTGLQNTTNAYETAELTKEIESILIEIETVATASQFNNASVVEAGTQSFEVSLDSEALGSGTSSGSLAITIQNVALSLESLGLPDVTSIAELDAFGLALDASDGSGLAILQSAQLQIDATQSSLAASAKQLNTVASAFGVATDIEADAITNGTVSDESPDALANRIVSDIGAALTAQAGALNPLRIEELLRPVESPPRSDRSVSELAKSISDSESSFEILGSQGD